MEITEIEVQKWKDKICKMTQYQMASLHRFSPSGHPVFDNRNNGLHEYFVKKFNEKGGMTTEISKEVGW